MFHNIRETSGANTHVIQFANALARQPHTAVTLLYPQGADLTVFDSNVQILPVTVPSLLQSSLPGALLLPLWNLFFLWMLVRHNLFTGRFDAIYVRYAPSVIFPFWIIRPLLSRTLLLLEINTPAAVAAANAPAVVQRLSRMMDRVSMAVCDVAFVVSRDLEEIMVEMLGPQIRSKIRVNVNGVDAQLFGAETDRARIATYRASLGIDEEVCLIGYVGKALPHHRLEKVAEVIRQIEGRPLRFALAGSIAALPADQIELLEAGNTLLLGRIPFEDVSLFLNSCDILILTHGPSYAGRLHQSPIKLFEYMAVEKPIVASRIGQIGRVLSHEVNAMLFEPDDSDELRTCIQRLVEDPALRTRLAYNARQTVVSHYTWDHNAQRVLDAIHEQTEHDYIPAH